MSCQVYVPASGLSLVQRSPTECGVPECDRETLILRILWASKGRCAMENGGGDVPVCKSLLPSGEFIFIQQC